jgi:hypothetical protein
LVQPNRRLGDPCTRVYAPWNPNHLELVPNRGIDHQLRPIVLVEHRHAVGGDHLARREAGRRCVENSLRAAPQDSGQIRSRLKPERARVEVDVEPLAAGEVRAKSVVRGPEGDQAVNDIAACLKASRRFSPLSMSKISQSAYWSPRYPATLQPCFSKCCRNSSGNRHVVVRPSAPGVWSWATSSTDRHAPGPLRDLTPLSATFNHRKSTCAASGGSE